MKGEREGESCSFFILLSILSDTMECHQVLKYVFLKYVLF